ncbi:MAG: translation initiation factor IF-5A, partial [Candidatus Micrarchaeota archaeon]
KPSDADVEVPIIERKTAQIVSISGSTAQLMDLASYEIFELPIPEDMMEQAGAGKEAEYMETMGKRAITRVRE